MTSVSLVPGGNAPLLPQGPATPRPPDPLDAMVARFEREDQRNDQLLVESFHLAAKANPKLARDAGQIATELGLDPLLAERNLDVVREHQRRRQLEERVLGTVDPILKEKFRNPIFARKAVDDYDNLSAYTKASHAWEFGRLLVERNTLGTWLKFSGGDESADADPAKMRRIAEINARMKQIPPTEGFYNVFEVGAQFRDPFLAGAAAASAVALAGQAGPQAFAPEEILTVPLAFTIGALSVGLPQAYMMEGGGHYLDLREKGVSHANAAPAAFTVGLLGTIAEFSGARFLTAPIRQALRKRVVTGLLDEIATPTWTKAAAKTALGYAKAVGGEIGTELVQETTQILSEGAQTGNWEGAGERLAQIAVKTFYGVSLLALPGAAMQINHEMGRVAWARKAGEYARRKATAVALSKLGADNPAALEQFANDADAATGLVNVYLDATQLEQLLRQGGAPQEGEGGGAPREELFDALDRVMPGMSEQVREAAKRGSDIVMPSGTFQVKLSGFAGGALMPHARWGDENALSEFDADRTDELVKELLEPNAEVAAEQLEANIRQLKVIEQTLAQQLNETGLAPFKRMDEAAAQAKLWTAFVEVNRERLAMTPEQFQAAFPLTAMRGEVAGNAFMQSNASMREILDRYDIGGENELQTVDDVIEALEELETMPGPLAEAIEQFHADAREDFEEHGMRSGITEESEERVMRALREAAGEPGADVAREPAAGVDTQAAPTENAPPDATGTAGAKAAVPVDATARRKRGRATTRGRPGWRARSDVAGTYATRTDLVELHQRELGTDVVTTPEQAAQAMAYLGRGAVERFDGLVTDKNGKPLALVGGFKGAIAEAPAYLPTVIGEAFRIKGAANIWFAHNHPSGDQALSAADMRLWNRFMIAFDGSRIEARGLMAIGGGAKSERKWQFVSRGGGLQEATVLPPSKPTPVSVVERVLEEDGTMGQAIHSPEEAWQLARQIAGGESGAILFDSRNRPIAFVPIDPREAGTLRKGGRMDALYRAVSVANGASAVIVSNGDLSPGSIANLGSFFRSLAMTPLDAVFPQGTVSDSWSSKFASVGSNTTFKQQQSTRLPSGEKATEDPGQNVLSTDFAVAFADEKALAKNVATMRAMPFLKLKQDATDTQVIEAYIKHVADNLDWLYRQMSPADRARARLWYDGGRQAVEAFAGRYGVSTMQAAAVIAVLSPQRDWFVNMSMAERMLDTVVAMRDHKWDVAMTERANRRIRRIPVPKGWKGKQKQLRQAVEGKSLGEVMSDPMIAAYWIRVFDATHNRGELAQWTPEGGTFGNHTTRLQWSAFPTLAKVVSILNDGSKENVSLQLGGAHKVRSFYNKLFAPKSQRGHLTLDTHAVAAAYLLPLAGGADLVKQVWGGAGGATSRQTGLLGLYPFMGEAYRRVAEKYGLLPREMQSITWEQVRLLFTPTEKRTGAQAKARVARINAALEAGEIDEATAEEQIEEAELGDLNARAAAIWAQHSEGKITVEEARDQVVKAFGGFDELSWKGQPTDVKRGDSYQGLARTEMKKRADLGQRPGGATKVMVEAKPNTNPELLARWEKLSPEAREAATIDVLSRVVPMVLKKHGVEGRLVPQRGGWKGAAEASIAVLVSDPDKAVAIADDLGAALHQEGMFIASLAAGRDLSASSAVRIDLPDGYTADQIDDLYTKVLWPITGLEGKHAVVGHSTHGTTMLIGVDPAQAGMTADQLKDAIKPMLADDFSVGVVDLHTAERARGKHYARQGTAQEPSAAAGSPAEPRADRDVAIEAEAARAYAGALDEAELRQREAAAAEDVAREAAADFFGQPGEGDVTRGAFDPATFKVILTKDANFSTFGHELGHTFLTIYERLWEQKAHPVFVDDFRTFLTWAGETEESWRGKTLEQKRKAHEMFAETFEAYLMEGKAPAPELKGLFARFAAFMRRVYTALTVGPDAKRLTPAIRSVMDRMVASVEAVRTAQAVRGAMPAFQTQVESGMDDIAWAEHKKKQQEADDEAIATMTGESLRVMRWLGREVGKADALGRKEAKEQRAKLAPEIEAAIATQPVYRAMRWLQTGEVEVDGKVSKEEGSHKLNREEAESVLIDEKKAEEVEAMRKFVSKDGHPIDVVADMFDFDSGRELVRAILEAAPLEQAVEQGLDERMLEDHPELADPRQRIDAAAQALHNEARRRFVVAELRALDKSLEPARVTLAAAKEVARQALERQQVGQLSWKTFAAKAKAHSQEAAMAVRKGDTQAAIAAKRKQIVQEQMAALSEDYRKATSKALRLFRSFNKPDEALAKRRDIDMAYSAQALAAAYSLGPPIEGEQRIALVDAGLARLKEAHPVEWSRLQPLLDRVKPAHLAGTATAPRPIGDAILGAATGRPLDWRQLTVAEFREVAQAGEQLWDAAADEQQLSAEAGGATTQTALQALAAQLAAAPARPSSATPPEDESPGWLKTKVLEGWGLLASTKIWEHTARRIDGGKEDGPFQRYLVLPLMRALQRYRASKQPVVQVLAKSIREAMQRHGAMWHSRIVVPGLRGSGLDFTFNGVREVLGAMLNAGAQTNLEANLIGRGWGEMVETKDGGEQLNTERWDAAVKWLYDNKILGEADNAFLTTWWDTFADLLPQAQKTHKKRFGYEFETIELRQVVTPIGTLKGGYVPKRTDRKLAPRKFLVRYGSADGEFTATADDFQYSVGSKKGFTLGRSDNYRPPLNLDVGSMVSNVDEELRFIHLEPSLHDAHKILRGRLETEDGGTVRFEDLLNEYDRELLTSVIVPTLQNAALQRTSLPTKWPMLDRSVRTLKSAASLAFLGLNLANSMLQAGGISNALLYVKGGHLRSAAMSVIWSPLESREFATEHSAYMQQRFDQQTLLLEQEIARASQNPFGAGWTASRQFMSRWAFFPQRFFQGFADLTTWHGAYQQAKADNATEETAVERADQAVRLAQGANLAESLAPFAISSPFMSLWTQFGNYSNLVLNQIMGSQSRAAAFAFALFLPAVLETAVKTLFRGGQDDEDGDDSVIDDLAMSGLATMARNTASLVPILGPLAVSMARSDGTRVLEAPGGAMLREFYRGFLEAGEAAFGGGVTTDAEKRAIATFLSMALGVPLASPAKLVLR